MFCHVSKALFFMFCCFFKGGPLDYCSVRAVPVRLVPVRAVRDAARFHWVPVRAVPVRVVRVAVSGSAVRFASLVRQFGSAVRVGGSVRFSGSVGRFS